MCDSSGVPPSLGDLSARLTSTAPSLQTALAGQQEAQAHRQTYHLEFVEDVQTEADLLALPEVDDGVEARARQVGRRVHWERRQWRGSTLSQSQLQSRSAPAAVHALVADVHVQEVGSRALDADSVACLSNYTHLVLAADIRKLQRLVEAAT